MYFLQELLDIDTLLNRDLYLMKDEKKIPMSLQYYVADDIFFFEVNEKAELSTLEDFRGILEEEAEDTCWREDAYIAPMDKISSCEMRFPKDFKEVIYKNIFDNCYEIDRINFGNDEIIIELK